MKLNKLFRREINKNNRRKLINRNFSLVASNCNGCLLSHDLGVRFNTPFVNLWMKPKDFIKCLSNLEAYMKSDLKFIKEDGIDYPVGLLKDVKIYFQHYSSNEEALKKWNSRKQRMDYSNLFIMMTDRDGCTYDDIVAFDKLPYKHKVIFTHVEYPEINSAYYIKGFENKKSVGMCFGFIDNVSGVKYYDQFNYVKWFNNKL